MKVPWTARRSNQSILRKINPEYSLERLMLKLKLKLQFLGHLIQRADLLEKTLMLGKIEDRRRGRQRVRWLDNITDPVDMNLSKLCCPLLLFSSIFPSIKVFSNESALHIRWPEYWSLSFGISPSSEYSGLISFRNDWFDLLAVQGTFKNLLQHCSLKASVAWVSAFFMVQHSNTHICT